MSVGEFKIQSAFKKSERQRNGKIQTHSVHVSLKGVAYTYAVWNFYLIGHTALTKQIVIFQRTLAQSGALSFCFLPGAHDSAITSAGKYAACRSLFQDGDTQCRLCVLSYLFSSMKDKAMDVALRLCSSSWEPLVKGSMTSSRNTSLCERKNTEEASQTILSAS